MPYDYWSGLIDYLPAEEHHILTNKHTGSYTEVFDDIVSTYSLDLDGPGTRHPSCIGDATAAAITTGS